MAGYGLTIFYENHSQVYDYVSKEIYQPEDKV